ncbi:fatty acid-binding protein, liver [Platysternon megacephalum]|uniref:Fatty acid-binding protein, liver n=1 Tax=Platysternon megacephalum TaxID=55544 RepID=A0A4D9EUG9_9SAUR|nr:fatty acid-binding protein, liver [Platysternon megacephalum]
MIWQGMWEQQDSIGGQAGGGGGIVRPENVQWFIPAKGSILRGAACLGLPPMRGPLRLTGSGPESPSRPALTKHSQRAVLCFELVPKLMSASSSSGWGRGKSPVESSAGKPLCQGFPGC